MNSRQRFLKACQCAPLDRPPMWVMRQAGRHLPEYMALKAKHTFHELVQTPELATEVTLQPVRRYGMDAAIIFSDILVIPEAMGQAYAFRDGGGIEMEYRLESRAQIDALTTGNVEAGLAYVTETIRRVRDALPENAVIGFGGAPWTLATYMVEGGSSRDYRRAKELYWNDRDSFDALMQKITDASIGYFQLQIEAGVDAIQLFDSWAGVLGPEMFWDASAKWMAKIRAALPDTPVICFPKGAHQHLDDIKRVGANVIGVDWTTDLAAVRRAAGDMGVQGNLDPTLMGTNPEIVAAQTQKLLESMRGLNGHIANLGHGVSPHARIDCMEAFVRTIKDFS